MRFFALLLALGLPAQAPAADLKDLAACAAKPSRRLLSSSHRTIVARKRP